MPLGQLFCEALETAATSAVSSIGRASARSRAARGVISMLRASCTLVARLRAAAMYFSDAHSIAEMIDR
jgi:hypothetical protein